MKSNHPRWLIMRAGSGIAALALVAGAFAAGPAGAAATHVRDAAAASAHPSLLAPAAVHLGTPSDDFGAGFLTLPYHRQQGVGSASVTFTVPSDVRCHSSSDAEWIGSGIWISDDDGFLTQLSGVAFNCDSGVLTVTDVICVNTVNCNNTLNVNPGDRVAASLSLDGSTYAAVHDLTTGGRVSVTGGLIGNQVSVDIGVLGPRYNYLATSDGATHVPTFSKIHFSKAQVNGQYLGEWTPTRFNLATNGPLQVKTSPLTGDGDAFTTTFQHN